MTLTAQHIADLKKIAGAGGWIADRESMIPFLMEPREKFQGATPLVLLPENTAKVAEIVTYCARHRLPLVPQGGNSGLVGGGVPTPAGDQLVISLKRLDKIRAKDVHNHTLTVEAGCILANVQQAARDMGYLFPLSLAAEGSCMIGGNISTNAGGVNVLRYGNMRPLVLGLEAVLPDGRVWDGLTGLRKNNTGYDLKQLFIGGEGTLGIVTAATLTLFPAPREIQTAFVAVPHPRAAVDLLALARDISGNGLSAFEIIPRIGLDFVTRHMPGTRDPMNTAHDWYVLLECTSSQSRELLDLKKVLEHVLGTAMERDLVRDGVIAKNQAESAALWRLREHLSEAQKFEGGSIKHDIAVPISAIPDFLSTADAVVEATIPGARPVPFGHIGDGNLHYNISQPLSADMARDKQAFLDQWPLLNRRVHDVVRQYNGSFSAEHGIGRLKIGEMQRYKSAVELDMMKKIKAALDPDNIMNPGVIIE